MSLTGKYPVSVSYVPLDDPAKNIDLIDPPAGNGWNKTFDGAVAKVMSVTGTPETVSAKVTVFTSDTEEEFIERLDVSFPPDMSGSNFIKQAYEYLKTLSQFSGMADVLEKGQTA